jgi:hypothetical protein
VSTFPCAMLVAINVDRCRVYPQSDVIPTVPSVQHNRIRGAAAVELPNRVGEPGAR